MPRKRRYEPKGISEFTSSTPQNPKFRDGQFSKSRTKSYKTKLFPAYIHSRTKDVVTGLTDDQYFNAVLNTLYHSDTNSKAAFKDWLIACYKEGKISGNMKDVNANEETAFSVVGLDSFMISFEIAYSLLHRELIGNPPESNTTTTTSNDIVCWEEGTFRQIINDLENKSIVIPSCIKQLVRDLLFVVKLDEEYSQGPNTLPPRYLMPFCPSMSLAEAQVFIAEWASNNSLAKVHMDKFGIKYETWTVSMCEDAPEKNYDDPDVIAWAFAMPMSIYQSGDHSVYPDGVNLAGTATWTTKRHYFKEDPNESKLDAYAPLFFGYHATNNPYGGILSAYELGTTNNDINMSRCDYHEDTAYTSTNLEESAVGWLFRAFCESGTLSNLALSWTGAFMSTDDDLDVQIISEALGLKYGTGTTKTTLEGILKLALIQVMF